MKVANTLAYYDMATITALKGLKYRLWSLHYKNYMAVIVAES